jgi:hypothetical protein
MSTNPIRAGVNPAPTVIEPKHKIVGVEFIPTRKISISESTQLFRLLIMLECSMCFYKKPYALCPMLYAHYKSFGCFKSSIALS